MTDRGRAAPRRADGTHAADGVDALVDEALPAADVPRRSWWRRSRLALAAVVVLGALCGGVIVGDAWNDWWGGRPVVEVRVPAGEPVELGGATWTLVSAERLPATSPELRGERMPVGSDVVLARLEVDPAPGGGPSCSTSLVGSGDGPDRRWRPELGGVRARSDDATLHGCSSEQTRPYALELAFVVPGGAEDELAIDVLVPEALPRHLVMELPEPEAG